MAQQKNQAFRMAELEQLLQALTDKMEVTLFNSDISRALSLSIFVYMFLLFYSNLFANYFDPVSLNTLFYFLNCFVSSNVYCIFRHVTSGENLCRTTNGTNPLSLFCSPPGGAAEAGGGYYDNNQLPANFSLRAADIGQVLQTDASQVRHDCPCKVCQFFSLMYQGNGVYTSIIYTRYTVHWDIKGSEQCFV